MAIHVPQAQEKTTIGDSTLRTTALWYPEIPPPSMDLNESSFIPPRDKYLSGFEPLVVCHFGGQDGRYLRHLVGITLTGVGDIRRMKFSYDDNDINVSPFGRTRPNDLLYVRDFPINGPGGEVIIAVDGIYCVTERTISLVYCKLTTNRGRLFEIPPTKPQTSYCTTVETMHVDAAAGTAITGFYGAQYPEFGWGMTTLGVISEVKREAGS
ncbi:hypothetical protein N0V82_008770 [Gnomoniopsis sp. IMI 355080]|nr:hypothetical protein N0V82_008770 [Gnomoniopsis sp. IMI 355080]